MRTTAVPALLLAVTAALGLAACNDDHADAAAAPTTTVVEQAGAPSAEYCDVEAQIDGLLGPAFGSGDPGAIVAAAAEAEPLLVEAEAAAPAEIADEVDALVAAVRTAGQGDAGALRTPDVGQASDRVTEYCGGAAPE